MGVISECEDDDGDDSDDGEYVYRYRRKTHKLVVCKRCYQRSFTPCLECSALIPPSEKMTYCGKCPDEGHEAGPYCSKCADKASASQDYCYRAAAMFCCT
eukprot:CAMPEP_0197065370 /NCGR_PEP_ID=MMETSP1384-20130603/166493_1 /TAXON_ID=29189 /ORGANISM="Ammonia sp." /LENGTH=99 /DNA_ID=CAMNT_0042502177 /DNA_START=1 /DNA_END=297 /DNA_ORIENTATION=-